MILSLESYTVVTKLITWSRIQHKNTIDEVVWIKVGTVSVICNLANDMISVFSCVSALKLLVW